MGTQNIEHYQVLRSAWTGLSPKPGRDAWDVFRLTSHPSNCVFINGRSFSYLRLRLDPILATYALNAVTYGLITSSWWNSW